MLPIEDRRNSENWTGEHDNVAAYTLIACLAIGALILATVAIAGLHP